MGDDDTDSGWATWDQEHPATDTTTATVTSYGGGGVGTDAPAPANPATIPHAGQRSLNTHSAKGKAHKTKEKTMTKPTIFGANQAPAGAAQAAKNQTIAQASAAGTNPMAPKPPVPSMLGGSK